MIIFNDKNSNLATGGIVSQEDYMRMINTTKCLVNTPHISSTWIETLKKITGDKNGNS